MSWKLLKFAEQVRTPWEDAQREDAWCQQYIAQKKEEVKQIRGVWTCKNGRIMVPETMSIEGDDPTHGSQERTPWNASHGGQDDHSTGLA